MKKNVFSRYSSICMFVCVSILLNKLLIVHMGRSAYSTVWVCCRFYSHEAPTYVSSFISVSLHFEENFCWAQPHWTFAITYLHIHSRTPILLLFDSENSLNECTARLMKASLEWAIITVLKPVQEVWVPLFFFCTWCHRNHRCCVCALRGALPVSVLQRALYIDTEL